MAQAGNLMQDSDRDDCANSFCLWRFGLKLYLTPKCNLRRRVYGGEFLPRWFEASLPALRQLT